MISPHPSSEDFLAREPFFSVVPRAEYLRRNVTPERERAFFASGETVVDWVFALIEPITHNFAPIAALEYGCGIGRISRPLSRRAGVFTAIDRSNAVLDLARAEATARNIHNIDFALATDVSAMSKHFDMVVCYDALQRLKCADGIALVRALTQRIGPGGVGVFHFPYRDRSSLAARSVRGIRQNIPAVNTLANRLRGKADDEPFVPTYTYPLDTMLRELRRTQTGTTHVVLDEESDTARATVIVWMPYDAAGSRSRHVVETEAATAAPAVHAAPSSVDLIDVKQLIAHASIDELNRTAELYFSTLPDWEHHLAKPFAKSDEVAPLLIDVATLVHGLQLHPGMTVLEYGSGSGWLSRYFTQLGCEAILLDVAPTALKMAQELYRRQPVIGPRPAPRFLPFDGRRIDLPDSSIDRIVCYHAFHHAANPDEVLREFGRVLKPGGVAAFSEPGPAHSRSARSQFEMRTYGVIENDVDLHAIWRTAQSAGFAGIRIALFSEPTHHVSLAEFEDLLTGGAEGQKWLANTRRFLRNVRTFFLTKHGVGERNSQSIDGLACSITAARAPAKGRANTVIVIDAVVTNTGTATWLPWPERGGVALGLHLYDHTGALINFDVHCQPLVQPARDLAPGETVNVPMNVPPLVAGRYRLELDCVASGVTWFSQIGSRTITLPIEVESVGAVSGHPPLQ